MQLSARPAPLPSPPAFAELQGQGEVALFLDFDGTLVDIAPVPDAIFVPDHLASHLEQLSRSLGGRLALVSGRSIEDLALYLGDIALAKAGSHGAARQNAAGQMLGEPPGGLSPDITNDLAAFAQTHGLGYEAKTHGGALHFRQKPGLATQTMEFAQALADREGLAVKHGKCVVELVEKGADKGKAVTAFMDEAPFIGARPIFIGDDVTDEDGFRACQAIGGIGILVGPREGSCANYMISDVAGVHQWLGL